MSLSSQRAPIHSPIMVREKNFFNYLPCCMSTFIAKAMVSKNETNLFFMKHWKIVNRGFDIMLVKCKKGDTIY